MKNEQIFLSKNFTIIESGIPFILRFNRKDSSASSAEDTIYMKSGWYIFDNNKLLPYEVEGVKNSPKYNAWVEYDESKLNERVQFRWYTSWVNPKSIESLNSDVYELDAVQFTDITDKINSIISKDEERNSYLSEISEDVDSLEANVADISNDTSSIKTGVDDVVRLLGSLDNGTVLNELEQIRTVLKSPSTVGNSTPWGNVLGLLESVKQLIDRSNYVSEDFLLFEGKELRFICSGSVAFYREGDSVAFQTKTGDFSLQCYGKQCYVEKFDGYFDNVKFIRVNGKVRFF